MTLGLTKDEISAMLAGAGERMEQNYQSMTKTTEQMSEIAGLFSSMMVTLSSTVQDIVLANNDKIIGELKSQGLLK